MDAVKRFSVYSATIVLCIFAAWAPVEAKTLSLEKWTYIEVDSCRGKASGVTGTSLNG